MTKIYDLLLRVRVMRSYFARALAALHPVERPGLKTVGVDKFWRLYFDAEWLESLTEDEQVAVIEHELGHLLRDHHARMKACGCSMTMTANLATDAEINDDLQGLPSDAIYPATLGAPDGLLAEEYLKYARDAEAEARASCGSGSGGVPLEGELSEKDAPALPADAADRVRDATAAAIREAVRHDPGSVPDGLRMWAEDRAAPVVVPWTDVFTTNLRREVSAWKRGRVDYSWRKLSRKARPCWPLRPGMTAPEPVVGIVVDVSGSMMESGAYVLGTVAHMARTSSTLYVYQQDAADEPLRTVGVPDQWIGGGGTNLVPAIEMAAKECDIVVVVTDGYTPWPSDPQVPVLVVTDQEDSVKWPTWVRKVVVVVE